MGAHTAIIFAGPTTTGAARNNRAGHRVRYSLLPIRHGQEQSRSFGRLTKTSGLFSGGCYATRRWATRYESRRPLDMDRRQGGIWQRSRNEYGSVGSRPRPHSNRDGVRMGDIAATVPISLTSAKSASTANSYSSFFEFRLRIGSTCTFTKPAEVNISA